MRHGQSALILLLASCSAAETPGNKQAGSVAAKKMPAAAAAAPGHYAGIYGISDEAEGRRRFDNEAHVAALARDLRLNPAYGFSDIWIEHAPKYEVVVAFKRPPARAAILKRADPTLRPYIVFRTATRDRAEIDRDTDRIIAAFRKMPVQWAGGWDIKKNKFIFDVAAPAGIAYAEKHLPKDLKDDVIVRVGSIPQPLTPRR